MFSPTSYFFVKKEETEDFSETEAKKRNFKRKEEKEDFSETEAKKRNFKRKQEKEAEWNARLTSSNRHFARLLTCFSNNFEL